MFDSSSEVNFASDTGCLIVCNSLQKGKRLKRVLVLCSLLKNNLEWKFLSTVNDIYFDIYGSWVKTCSLCSADFGNNKQCMSIVWHVNKFTKFSEIVHFLVQFKELLPVLGYLKCNFCAAT